MDTHSLLTLNLLASLVQARRLGDADERWLRLLATHVQARLRIIDFNEYKVSRPPGSMLPWNTMIQRGMVAGAQAYPCTFSYSSINFT